MGTYTWMKCPVPEDLPVRQVYGIAFSNDGRILLRIEDGKYKLTGGRPESGETFEETLLREYVEELNVNLVEAHYLGYLLVEEDGNKYAQVRMIARIKDILENHIDIATGKEYGRKLVVSDRVKEYLNYSDVAGNQMLEDAMELAKSHYGLDDDFDEINNDLIFKNPLKIWEKCMEINVRLEEENDYRRVEEITRAAFGYPDRVERGQIGCPYEHWMVHELRHRDGIKALSLVAELDEEMIVGHIICSNAVVRTENLSLPVLNFGPLSVLPEYQRRGVGGELIRAMIEQAKKLDYGAILFFGRPEYYPQFGFMDAEVFGIADAEGYNYPSFMAMELKEGYLKDVRGGRYYESDIYNDELNRETVRAFDREFIVRMPMII